MSRLLSFLLVVVIACGLASCREQARAGGSRSLQDTGRRVEISSATIRTVVEDALEQTTYTTGYDPAYVAIDYPGGDVPKETGVCADVVVRAFRSVGIDLQKNVHEDMKANFSSYPKIWGLKKPDRNIDHRRVANLMKYFERQGKSLPVTRVGSNYLPGDVVAWRLDGGPLHIGIVIDRITDDGTPLISHNIGGGTRIENVLFAWEVIGHYRYL